MALKEQHLNESAFRKLVLHYMLMMGPAILCDNMAIKRKEVICYEFINISTGDIGF